MKLLVHSTTAAAAMLLLVGCYDWAPGGAIGGGSRGDDDDSFPIDDDDSGEVADDDDVTEGPCSDSPAAESFPVDDACRVEVDVETEPELEIVWQYGVFETEGAYDQVMMTPIVVPLTDDDGDGAVSPGDERAILFVTYAGESYGSDGLLRALRGDGTSLLWTVTDPAWRLTPGANLAAGDIDGDGWPEIVGCLQSGVLGGFDRNGTPLWQGTSALNGTGNSPFLVDMDGDGTVEIVHGNQIFDSTGNLLGTGAHGTGATYGGNNYGASFAVDLDLDGQQEVIVGNAAYDRLGNTLWFNGQPDGVPGVGNFDDDLAGEVVVVSSGSIRLQDTDGTVLLGPITIPGAGNGGPPTVADFDGDGMPEVGVANLSFYTMFDTDLTVLWTNPTEDDSSSLTGSSAFDFDADGASEVVYADEHDVWVWHGETGALIHRGSGHASGTLIEYPVVAQVLAAEGPPQIVVGSNDMWWEGWTGITLLADSGRTWVGTRQVWNQHAFLSTHINDDLTIPSSPATPWLDGPGLRENAIASVPGVSSPDLTLELHAVCEASCTVRLRPRNTGVNSGPFVVELLGDGFPLTTQAHVGLAGGTLGEVVELTLDPADVASISSLTAFIDPGGSVEECDETNNELVVPVPFCE